MSLLEQNMARKKRGNKAIFRLEFNDSESNRGNTKYKVEAIWDSTVYVREAESYLLGFYYLILWKSYSEEENL